MSFLISRLSFFSQHLSSFCHSVRVGLFASQSVNVRPQHKIISLVVMHYLIMVERRTFTPVDIEITDMEFCPTSQTHL